MDASRTSQAEAFRNTDATSYDPVADTFDHFTNLTTKTISSRLIHWAGLRPQHHVLDVGTGTGVVAIEAARHIAPPGSVRGIDLSGGQIAVARRNATDAGLSSRVCFDQGDAEQLPYENQSFDVVLSLYTLLHLPNPGQALSQMYRVLKPGGTLAVGIGSPCPWNSLQGVWNRLTRVKDWVRLKQGKLLLAHRHLEALTDKHLPRGPAAPEITDLARHHSLRGQKAGLLVRNAGFDNIRTNWQSGKLVLESAEEFWRLQSTFSSLCRKRLSTATAEEVERLRADFFEVCNSVKARGGSMEYHYAALVICGTKPVH